MPPTKRLARKRPASDSSSPTTKRVSKRVASPPGGLQGPDPREDPEEEDDERPAPSMKSANGAGGRLRGGWTEGQRQNEATSSFAKSFRPEEKMQAIKFLQDSPYVSYRRHWIDSMNEQGQRTTRAYTCPLSLDPPEPCPLCEVGDRAQAVNSFNIALIGDDGQVLLRSWDVGVRLFNVLKGYSNDPKVAPLSKLYYLVSKTGQKTSTQYNVVPVRAASLEEDYDIPVPDDDEFARLERYDADVVQIEPPKKLRELAAELADG
jgi:hypothetical protein